MLFWAIGVLSVFLGFSTAVYVVFVKFGSKVTGLSVFITAASGTIFSMITGLVIFMVLWPPVTVLSWLIFLAFAGAVSLLVLTGKQSKKESGDNIETGNNLADIRSNTGS
ncbi:MAG: hypothetical protein CVU89_10900 [Firmicutes bacterium HGW-Firmicutes-14]|jgi:hypothetical protein|nr:MAG: hypothetical protein CVU89_10900 [Firmicutes bacterium HGW-Firmicutes-14]